MDTGKRENLDGSRQVVAERGEFSFEDTGSPGNILSHACRSQSDFEVPSTLLSWASAGSVWPRERGPRLLRGAGSHESDSCEGPRQRHTPSGRGPRDPARNTRRRPRDCDGSQASRPDRTGAIAAMARTPMLLGRSVAGQAST